MTRLALLLNATGREVLIENCEPPARECPATILFLVRFCCSSARTLSSSLNVCATRARTTHRQTTAPHITRPFLGHYNKLGPGEQMPAGALPDPRGIGRILPYWKNNISGGELVCPENLFRTSGDIRNSWASWFGNLQSTTLFQEPEHPISQPGCWAYPGATKLKCNIH